MGGKGHIEYQRVCRCADDIADQPHTWRIGKIDQGDDIRQGAGVACIEGVVNLSPAEERATRRYLSPLNACTLAMGTQWHGIPVKACTSGAVGKTQLAVRKVRKVRRKLCIVIDH